MSKQSAGKKAFGGKFSRVCEQFYLHYYLSFNFEGDSSHEFVVLVCKELFEGCRVPAPNGAKVKTVSRSE